MQQKSDSSEAQQKPDPSAKHQGHNLDMKMGISTEGDTNCTEKKPNCNVMMTEKKAENPNGEGSSSAVAAPSPGAGAAMAGGKAKRKARVAARVQQQLPTPGLVRVPSKPRDVVPESCSQSSGDIAQLVEVPSATARKELMKELEWLGYDCSAFQSDFGSQLLEVVVQLKTTGHFKDLAEMFKLAKAKKEEDEEDDEGDE